VKNAIGLVSMKTLKLTSYPHLTTSVFVISLLLMPALADANTFQMASEINDLKRYTVRATTIMHWSEKVPGKMEAGQFSSFKN
jgi:hypothetical protein